MYDCFLEFISVCSGFIGCLADQIYMYRSVVSVFFRKHSEESFQIKQTNKKANLRSTPPSRDHSLDLAFVRVGEIITPDNFAKANDPEDRCLLLRKVKSSFVVK